MAIPFHISSHVHSHSPTSTPDFLSLTSALMMHSFMGRLHRLTMIRPVKAHNLARSAIMWPLNPMISRVLNGAALHSGPVSAIDDDVRSTSYTAQPPETDPDTSRDCTDSDAEERAIYASWLETKWKHFVPRPCNHLLSNRVLDLLETKVPAHLQEDPLSPFRTESDRIDVATANLCLRLCRSLSRTSWWPRRAAKPT